MKRTLGIVFTTMLICFLLVNGVGAFVLFRVLPDKVSTPDIAMPSLEGLSLARAKYIIRLHQLELEKPVVHQADSKVLVNHVLAQRPAADFKIKPGRMVRLIVSSGAEMITIPSLVGMSAEQAEKVLNQLRLRLGQVAAVHSSYVPKANTVIAQTPETGTFKPRRSPVNLLLSLGLKPVPFLMPNLEGMHLDQVRSKLEKNGLKIGLEKYQPHNQFGHGKIIGHQPGANTVIQPGATIDLQISGTERFESKTSYFVEVVHKVSGISEPVENGEKIKEKVPKKYVQIIIDDLRGQQRIVNSNYRPGTLIRKPYKAVGSAVMRIYEDYELVREEKLE